MSTDYIDWFYGRDKMSPITVQFSKAKASIELLRGWSCQASETRYFEACFQGRKVTASATGATFNNEIQYVENISALNKKVYCLEKEIADLRDKYNQLVEKDSCAEDEELELRDISFSEAKVEIKKYFEEHHGRNIDAADIQEDLGIDIFLAMKVCDELENEGEIKKS